MSTNKCTVFAVINRKGGTGKTTTAVALADQLARRERERGNDDPFLSLLVDLDPQGHVAQALGLETEGRCIGDLLSGHSEAKDVIMKAATPGRPRPGLWVIPASNALAEAKESLMAMEGANAVMSHFLSKPPKHTSIDDVLSFHLNDMRRAFRYIVLDCPPTLDALQTAVYRFADEALVPVKTDYLGTMGAIQHTEDILREQTKGIEITVRGIIPTFVDRRNGQTKRVIKRLVSVYGRERILHPIPNTVRLAEPPEFGMTLAEYVTEENGGKYALAAMRAYDSVVDAVAKD